MAESTLRLVEAAAAENDPLVPPLALFHRVNSLVPDRQDLCTVEPDTSIRDALEVMKATDFSQVPVVAGDEVLGLFSYRSLAQGVANASGNFLDHEVEDFAAEPAFARITDELHEIVPELDRDGAVLVGDPNNLLAVVTPTDVTAYLRQVTEPFVLLQEIELVLRSLVAATCPHDDIADRIAAAIADEYRGREDRIPTRLDRLTLNQLVMVVLNGRSYAEVFSQLFGRSKQPTKDNLEPLGEIRNAVLHFRRHATEDDLRQLLSARAWLLRKARRLSGERWT